MSEVVIIGAGPAGLAAALSASAFGARVVVLDAADDVGGQYWRHLPPERPSNHESLLHHGWATFQRMREALAADPNCTVVSSAHVWAIDRGAVHVLVGEADGSDRESRVYRPDALVLATGAFDRTLPVPGWDLPGVFTAGGAQALAKGERVAVGERVVVAGAGPFLLAVAASVVATGASVVGVYEASRATRLVRHWAARPWELAATPAKARELAGYAAVLVRHRIAYVAGHAVTAIEGRDRVESVTVSALDGSWRPIKGSERQLEADAVCLGHGFTPRLELAIAAGCRLSDRRFVEVDAEQRTSVASVFAAGEITGIGGVDLALAEGAIAGHVAAGGGIVDPALRVEVARRRVLRRFARRLARAHVIGENWATWLSDETIVCRCEDVSVADLAAARSATRSSGLRSLKLVSRAGLGPCQGRVCGRTVEALLSARAPEGRLGGASTDRRPIAMPIRLGELAGGQNVEAGIPVKGQGSWMST